MMFTSETAPANPARKARLVMRPSERPRAEELMSPLARMCLCSSCGDRFSSTVIDIASRVSLTGWELVSMRVLSFGLKGFRRMSYAY